MASGVSLKPDSPSALLFLLLLGANRCGGWDWFVLGWMVTNPLMVGLLLTVAATAFC